MAEFIHLRDNPEWRDHMVEKKILVTGATGGNAIKKLLELKVPVRALVHKVDERSEKLGS
jgi:hypothetical protein